jgi:hypothetical protein
MLTYDSKMAGILPDNVWADIDKESDTASGMFEAILNVVVGADVLVVNSLGDTLKIKIRELTSQ